MPEPGSALKHGGRAWLAWLSDCGTALLLIALLNLPFWVLELRYVVARPVFNVDAAIALLLAPAGGAWWMFVLAVAWVLDLLQGVAIGFHFGSINNLLATVRFLPHVEITEFMGPRLAIFVGVFAACLVAVIWVRRITKPRLSALVAVLAVITIADVANGSGLPLLLKRDPQGGMNLQGSPAFNLVAAALASREHEAAAVAMQEKSPAKELLQWTEAHQSGSVFFVVVESWGEYADPTLRESVETVLSTPDASSRWQVSRRSVPSRGATTAGEIRLLCGSGLHYSQIGRSAEHCVGNALKERGFSTVAFHGFSRFMFDRTAWWPSLGFDRMVFVDNLDPGAPRCGTVLRGVCDTYMVDAAVANLGPGRFVYLLTLDTHLPLSPVTLSQKEADICSQRDLSFNVCQHSTQIRRLLDKIVSSVATLSPAPLLVLAGDHPPPFFDAKDQSMFFARQVPLIIARPR